MEYSAEVRLRFLHVPHAGELPQELNVLTASAGSVEQGTRFALYGRVSSGRIIELKHQVYGCPHCIAAVSLACEQLVGADLRQLEAWSWRAVGDALQVPPEKRGRLLVLEDAVRALAKAWSRCP